ncbi:DNA helicase RecQ [Kordiimonas aestuarii]|uniref:DNA helicase RecQ n=1 Tax=Kordiimonas aestuarii TaxID=1005925 RepID=UPI0021D079D9|nr:DNA helicase RecQ [Kordiimonas aestuarii]
MTSARAENSINELLREVFGFSAFRRGQQHVAQTLVEGRNMLAIMPTGAGKSLCYQIAALVRPGVTVVVSPLLALMDDQVASLKANGVAAETINSTRSRDEKIAIWKRLTGGELKLLYMSPEQLMNGRVLSSLTRQHVAMFIVDEAHCVSQWGHDFRPEYRQLNALRETFPGIPIGAFTATADERTRREIMDNLLGNNAEVVVQGFDRPNIRIDVQQKNNASKQLLDFLQDFHGQQGIVYCLSRARVEATAKLLNQKGYKALPYHAGLPADVRQENQELFLSRSGIIMVATIAFGMGIDKPDVRFVMHMDLPSSMEAYYQEMGRAGRDGAPARAMMLYGFDNIRARREMINGSGASEEKKRSEQQRLNALLAFCEAATCRRNVLLRYFGDAEKPPCGHCDTCLYPPDVYDGTPLAKLALGAIDATGEIYGRTYIVDLLVGAGNQKLKASGHDRLEIFGLGRDVSGPEWQNIFRQMLACGLVDVDTTYGSLKIRQAGRAVLHGTEHVQFVKGNAAISRRRKKVVREQHLSTGDEALFEHLKAVRLELAREENVPAYVIFHDAVLMEFSALKPGNEPEMLAVSGVGPRKVEKYGATFIKAVANFRPGPGPA